MSEIQHGEFPFSSHGYLLANLLARRTCLAMCFGIGFGMWFVAVHCLAEVSSHSGCEGSHPQELQITEFPQKRKRMFLVAIRIDSINPAIENVDNVWPTPLQSEACSMLQGCQPFLQMFQARLIDFLETDPIQDHPMVDEESMPGTFHANLEYVGASIHVSPFGQSKYSCPSSGASPLRGCCRWRTSAISPSDESMERKKGSPKNS